MKTREAILSFCIAMPLLISSCSSAMPSMEAKTAAPLPVQSTASSNQPATPPTVNTSADTEPAKTTTHLTKALSDQVTIDADVFAPTGLRKADVIQVDAIKPDTGALIKGLSIDTGIFIQQQNKDYFQPGEERFFSNDGGVFCNQPGSFVFYTTYSQQIDTAYSFAKINIADPLLQKTEFSFKTRDQAVRQAQQLLNGFGISTTLKSIFSLDYQTLQESERQMKNDPANQDFISSGKMDLRGQWDENDNCYSITLLPTIDGLPLDWVGRSIGNSDSFYPGSSINLLVTKAGIQSLDAEGIYSKTAVLESGKNLLGLDAVLPQVQKKFDSMIIKDKVTITEIWLMYIPFIINKDQKPPYKMRPCWCFVAEQINSVKKGNAPARESKSDLRYYFDAITGKEVT